MKFQNLKTSLKNSETFLSSLKFVKIPSTTPSHFQAWFEIEVFQLILATPDVTQQNGVLQICSKECRIRARWFIDKNNSVYKTERKETIHMLFFTTSDIKNARQFILTSAKSYCNFHMLCTILSTANFHAVPPMFLFLFSWSHLKAGGVYSSDWSLFRKRSIMGQLNVPAAAAENEEQYTLSNTIYIAFQNLYSFL